jgi:endonuclease-3
MQSSNAVAMTPKSHVMKSKLSRVVSPDVVVRSLALFATAENNDSSVAAETSGDVHSSSVNPPTSRKRKTRTQIPTENPVTDDIQETKTISEPNTPSPKPKRTKVRPSNAVTATVSTPIKSTSDATAIITPGEEESSEKKQSISNRDRIKAPNDWLETYHLVKELRQDRTAPCDHSGCEALPDPNTNPLTRRFQVLMCLMLSSQTKDAVVGAAIRTMQADHVLNIHSIHQMDATTLDRYIQKVGFHNNKTKYIKEAVQILMDKYNGDIPRTAGEMIQDLPGIGPKMAYIIESVAWGTQSGIGVDTHMHRIFNILHWVNKTNTPEKTRLQLESWLPREYWSEVNLLWVGFGQEVQQEKPKILRKALACSRPKDALQLLKRCGLDYRKVGKELDILDEIDAVLNS